MYLRMLAILSCSCFCLMFCGVVFAQEEAVFFTRLQKYIDSSESATFECRVQSVHEGFSERLLEGVVESTASTQVCQELIMFCGRKRTWTFLENISGSNSRNARAEAQLRSNAGQGRSLTYLMAMGIKLKTPEVIFNWEDSVARPLGVKCPSYNPFDVVTFSAGTYDAVVPQPGAERLGGFKLVWEDEVDGKLSALLRYPNNRAFILVEFRKSPDHLIDSIKEYRLGPGLQLKDEEDFSVSRIKNQRPYAVTRTIWRNLTGRDDWVPVEITMEMEIPVIRMVRHIRYVNWELEPRDVGGLEDANVKLSREEAVNFDWWAFRERIESESEKFQSR